MPPEIRRPAAQYLYDPVDREGGSPDAHGRHRRAVRAGGSGAGQVRRARRVLEAEQPEQALVFVQPKVRCEQLFRTCATGVQRKALHGDMTQGARDGVMISLKEGRLPLLVATDVAARGLDISGYLARDQLRRADLSRRLCAPYRPDRAGRARRARDHALRAPPAARDRGHRTPTPGSTPPWVRGSWRRLRPGAAPAPLQASRVSPTGTVGAQADPGGWAGRGARALGLHPRGSQPGDRPGRGGRPECAGARAVCVRRGACERDAARVIERTGGTEIRGHTLCARAGAGLEPGVKSASTQDKRRATSVPALVLGDKERPSGPSCSEPFPGPLQPREVIPTCDPVRFCVAGLHRRS